MLEKFQQKELIFILTKLFRAAALPSGLQINMVREFVD